MSLTVSTDELDRLIVDMGRKEAGMDDQTALVVRKSAFDIQARSMGNAPVRTGFLRSSHTVRFTGNNSRLHSAEVVAEAEYAPYVEWGTSRQAPQLFMTRAVEVEEPRFLSALAQIAADPGIGQ